MPRTALVVMQQALLISTGSCTKVYRPCLRFLAQSVFNFLGQQEYLSQAILLCNYYSESCLQKKKEKKLKQILYTSTETIHFSLLIAAR